MEKAVVVFVLACLALGWSLVGFPGFRAWCFPETDKAISERVQVQLNERAVLALERIASSLEVLTHR